jgi:hypothetical protein
MIFAYKLKKKLKHNVEYFPFAVNLTFWGEDMKGQTLKLKINRRYEKISILLMAIVFSVIVTARILVPVLKKAQESMKVQKKLTLKVTEKSAMIERAQDNSNLNPPKVEKETFVHYVKAIREWGECLDED